jgi:type I restriction enzyme S subunit
MNSWKTITMGELIDKGEASLQTGPFGTQFKASEYVESGIPMVNVKNIGYGDIRTGSLDYLDEKTAYRLRAHRLKTGDIVFGRKGSADRHVLIGPAANGWVQGSDCIRLRLKSEQITPRFLSYYFCTSGHKYWMEAVCAFGATMSTLNQGIVRRIALRVPRVEIQNKIAAVLSSYDQLIESNNRQIALLEKLAEEIYREWFIRLRFPGHEKVKVVKGVPHDWDVLPFSRLVNVNPTERIDKSEEIPFVGMDNLSVTSMFFTSKETRKGGQGAKFRNRDVLFPRITPSVENGKRGFVMTLAEGQIGFGSTEFIVLREKIIGSEHIYFLTCSADFRKHAELSMTGASGRQRVQEECFSFFLVKTPPPELRQRFSEIVRPHFTQIHLLSREIEHLTKTRDLLLPRLISGKLSVENLDIHFPPGMAEEVNAEPAASTHA